MLIYAGKYGYSGYSQLRVIALLFIGIGIMHYIGTFNGSSQTMRGDLATLAAELAAMALYKVGLYLEFGLAPMVEQKHAQYVRIALVPASFQDTEVLL